MPDIGNTTEFANYNFTWEGDGNDSIRGIQITMPEDGTAVSISAYITTGGNSSRTAVFALYDSSGNLLAYSDESAGNHTDEDLLTLNLVNEVSAGDLDLTNGSSYYLFAAFSSGSAAGGIANDGISGTAHSGDNSATYPSLAATAGTISQSQPDYSIYLTYTSGVSRSVDSLTGAFRRGNTGITVECTGLDVAPTTQTVTVTDGTHSDTCTITNWNSGDPIINIDCELPPGAYDIQVTDDTGTVTLAGQTLLIETNWEQIVFSGTTPPASEDSLPRETPIDHPTIPEIIAGDSWGVETHANITWDTDGQAVISPAGQHTLNYWFWDDSTGIMYSGETIVIGERPALTNPTLTSTGENTMQGTVDTDTDTGTAYAYWITSPTPPSETDLINGTGAAWHGSLPISSIGTKTFNATGLPSNTVHYAHYLHDNSGSRSAILTSTGVATDPGGGGNQAPVINDQSFNFVLSPNSNLLTNGDFSNGETGWDDANDHWLIESGRAHHPSSNAFNVLRQSIVSSRDKIAKVSFDYEILTGNLLPGWWTSSGGFISAVTSVVAPGSGSYSENVIVPANAEYLGFNRQTGTTLDAYLDNVSVVQLSGCSIIGTVHASDPDGDPLTFSIIAGNTDNDITIDTNTGELSWANVPDVNRTAIYNLTIQVSDGTDIDTGVVTIYVVELVYRQGNTISLSIDIGSI